MGHRRADSRRRRFELGSNSEGAVQYTFPGGRLNHTYQRSL